METCTAEHQHQRWPCILYVPRSQWRIAALNVKIFDNYLNYLNIRLTINMWDAVEPGGDGTQLSISQWQLQWNSPLMLALVSDQFLTKWDWALWRCKKKKKAEHLSGSDVTARWSSHKTCVGSHKTIVRSRKN